MKFWKYLTILLVLLIMGVGIFYYTNLHDLWQQKMDEKAKERLTVSLRDESFQYFSYRKLPPPLPEIEKKLTLHGFRLTSKAGASGFVYQTMITVAPANAKWAEKLQKMLGGGQIDLQADCPPEEIKITLGLDLIVANNSPGTKNSANFLLNASGKAELNERIATLLTDKGLKIAAAQTVANQPRTLILAPPSLKDKAELAQKILDRGEIKFNAGLTEVLIYLGEDYTQPPPLNAEAANSPAKATSDPNKAATSADQVVKNPRYPYWAVIDKSDFILRLYNQSNQLIKTFPIAYGMDEDGVDKKTANDNRTPEGDFFICQIQDSSYWKFDGEEGAYGPYFLRLKTPWEGIGIHGTNHPESIGKKATHGCIRLNSNDLLELKKYVDLGMPVRIQP